MLYNLLFYLDVSLYVKFCTECQMPYRYQEYQDGVHNFNDNWLLSLGVCDMIRKHIQVIVPVFPLNLIVQWLQFIIALSINRKNWVKYLYSCPRLLNDLNIIFLLKRTIVASVPYIYYSF